MDSHDSNDMDGEGRAWQEAKCNLIVNYIPQDLDDGGLRGLFAEHGEIVHVKIIRDKHTKKSLGYGFVKFSNEEDAMNAIRFKNGFLIGQKRLKVSVARPPTEEIRNCKLYITNLPRTMSDADIHNLFSKFGRIIECRVLKDRNKSYNKGVAFIQFSVRSESDAALSLNGRRFEGCDRELVVKYAEDQQKKRDRRVMPPHDLHLSHDGRPYNDMYVPPPPKPGMHIPTLPLPGHHPMSPPGSPLMVSPRFVQHNAPPAAHQRYPGMPKFMDNGMQDWMNMQQHMSYDSARDYPSSQPPAFIYNQIAHLVSPRDMMSPQISPRDPHAVGQLYYLPPGTIISPVTSPRSYEGSVAVRVSNLPSRADVAVLYNLFSPYGRILSAQIDVDNSYDTSGGPCMGTGTVHMEGMAQAQHAARLLNDARIFDTDGPALRVTIQH